MAQDREDQDRERLLEAAGEEADLEVVERPGEGEYRRRGERRRQLRQHDVAKFLQLRGTEIDRGLLQRSIEADEAGGDDRDDEGEGDDELHHADRLQRE